MTGCTTYTGDLGATKEQVTWGNIRKGERGASEDRFLLGSHPVVFPLWPGRKLFLRSCSLEEYCSWGFPLLRASLKGEAGCKNLLFLTAFTFIHSHYLLVIFLYLLSWGWIAPWCVRRHLLTSLNVALLGTLISRCFMVSLNWWCSCSYPRVAGRKYLILLLDRTWTGLSQEC